ncbi:MAG: substrate-binding domain-containing protein [Clostridiales Family XIII bacterium]|nr:substrate-binding domain-containing protein [Clostridiales Family XIII bacterium]
MTRRTFAIGVAILAAIIVSTVLVRSYIIAWETAGSNERRDERIAVVLSGASQERWQSASRGIFQACDDLGIRRPQIVYSGAEDDATQLHIAEQEVEAGARALIIVANGDDETSEGLEALAKTIPIVTLESGTGGDIVAVGADDDALGAMLRNHIEKNAPNAGKILIIESDAQRESVRERIDGFLRAAGTNANISSENIGRLSQTTAKRVSVRMQFANADIAAVFDAETMDIVADAIAAVEIDTKIYGVGISEKAIQSLEQGSTEALCYVDEFSMGYISLMRVAEELGYDVERYPSEIKTRIITRDNLFDRDVERLIFPSN